MPPPRWQVDEHCPLNTLDGTHTWVLMVSRKDVGYAVFRCANGCGTEYDEDSSG